MEDRQRRPVWCLEHRRIDYNHSSRIDSAPPQSLSDVFFLKRYSAYCDITSDVYVHRIVISQSPYPPVRGSHGAAINIHPQLGSAMSVSMLKARVLPTSVLELTEDLCQYMSVSANPIGGVIRDSWRPPYSVTQTTTPCIILTASASWRQRPVCTPFVSHCTECLSRNLGVTMVFERYFRCTGFEIQLWKQHRF
jgi:hypothetical protein